MKLRRVLALSAFLITFAGAPVRAQSGIILGTVTEPDGQPIGGVTIKIEGQNLNRSYQVQTNRNGDYIHIGVSLQGIYRVTASKEGYSSESVSDVRPSLSRDGTEGRADFVLQPLAVQKQHPASKEQRVRSGSRKTSDPRQNDPT